jgi:hypothetical protein
MFTTIEEQPELQARVQRGRVGSGHPDLHLFHQDRYRRSSACILFPSTAQATVDFIKSLSGSPAWLTEEERLALADEDAARKPPLRQRIAQLQATAAGAGALDLRQRLFPLKYLPEVLWHCQGRLEHYLAQNSFHAWPRASDNVNQLTSCWVDLDFYKLDDESIKIALAHDDVAVDMIIARCTEGLADRWFLPTQIVRSGRGLYVKWVFSHFLPGAAAPRWRRCMESLVRRFKDFGADPAARDAARVLRVVGSRNSKSKSVVQVLHAGQPILFDDIAAALLPRERASAVDRWATKALAENAKKRFGPRVQNAIDHQPPTFDPARSWPALVAAEVKQLATMRGAGARGHIEELTYIHINFQLMCKRVTDREDFERQVEEIGTVMGGDVTQLRGKVSNLWRRRESGLEMYRFKKQTVIDLLEITIEELAQLPCLARSLGGGLRKPTIQTRIELAENQQRALLLERSGMQLQDIAQHIGISQKTVKRWLIAAR